MTDCFIYLFVCLFSLFYVSFFFVWYLSIIIGRVDLCMVSFWCSYSSFGWVHIFLFFSLDYCLRIMLYTCIEPVSECKMHVYNAESIFTNNTLYNNNNNANNRTIIIHIRFLFVVKYLFILSFLCVPFLFCSPICNLQKNNCIIECFYISLLSMLILTLRHRYTCLTIS